MAQCPNCNKKLHIWNVKAECPYCKKNIPNFDWENRLEEEAVLREEAFFKMHTKLNRIKFAAFGTPLRIIRFICSFLPIIGYVLPIFSLIVVFKNTDLVEINGLGLISIFTDKLYESVDFSLLISISPSDARFFGLLSFGVIAVSLIIGVIAFFCNPLVIKNFKSSKQFILHLIGTVLYASSPLMLTIFNNKCFETGYGDLTYTMGYGFYAGAVFFVLATVIDLIVMLKPVSEKDGKYIPTTDELQREYAISIGAIKEDEYPDKKEKKK